MNANAGARRLVHLCMPRDRTRRDVMRRALRLVRPLKNDGRAWQACDKHRRPCLRYWNLYENSFMVKRNQVEEGDRDRA